MDPGRKVVALEHVEEKCNIKLSRSLAFPNISSKGKLESRSVLVPVYENESNATISNVTNGISKKFDTNIPSMIPLIEEIGSGSPLAKSTPEKKPEKPKWSLSKLKDNIMRIELEMPTLVMFFG